MAVAVKTSPTSREPGTFASLAVVSLVGVAYLIGCLGILFKLLPDLWWTAWDAAGFGASTVIGGTFLAIAALAVGFGLIRLGGKLLGPNPPAGVRAGVFVGFVGLLFVLLLTRWASLWLEHWAYDSRWFGKQVGAILTAAVGLLLLVLFVRLFTGAWMQRRIVTLEKAGWFHATSYKGNQGLKVRRGTIFGILALVGAGIWTLMSHGTLRRGNPDWVLPIPFANSVAVESVGDTHEWLADADIKKVEVRSAGKSDLKPGKVIGVDTFQQAVNKVLDDGTFPDGVRETLEQAAKKDTVDYLLAINKVIYGQMSELLRLKAFSVDASRRLAELDRQADIMDISELIPEFRQVARREKKEYEISEVFNLPTAVPVVDQYVLRDINDKAEPKSHVKVGLPGDSTFPTGKVVTRKEFDEEMDRLKAEQTKGRDRELPQEVELRSAGGKPRYESLTLLPSVQYTVPLLMLALSLWLAWRIVNMPTFADFLIATEAELNKVSWTTQKRLVQDTIVVLVTLVLMAVYLFGMDIIWKQVLSWKPIGVLYIPPDNKADNETVEQKRW